MGQLGLADTSVTIMDVRTVSLNLRLPLLISRLPSDVLFDVVSSFFLSVNRGYFSVGIVDLAVKVILPPGYVGQTLYQLLA